MGSYKTCVNISSHIFLVPDPLEPAIPMHSNDDFSAPSLSEAAENCEECDDDNDDDMSSPHMNMLHAHVPLSVSSSGE